MGSIILFILTCVAIGAAIVCSIVPSVVATYRGIVVTIGNCDVHKSFALNGYCYYTDCDKNSNPFQDKNIKDGYCDKFCKNDKFSLTQLVYQDYCDAKWGRQFIRASAIIGLCCFIGGGVVYILTKCCGFGNIIRILIDVALGVGGIICIIGVICFAASNTFGNDYEKYYTGFYFLIAAGVLGIISCILSTISLRKK